MRFIDQIDIQVTAGKGGNGSCSFRREKFIPRGGPDGGNGGCGGSVFLCADPNVRTFSDLKQQRCYRAQDGMSGRGARCTGRHGQDVSVAVPLGTIVYAQDSSDILGELLAVHDHLCVARGGRAGVGNACFKTSINQAPRRTIPGECGESRHLHLELKLLADVGILGCPNAGKSMLLNSISRAASPVGAYPFTTVRPYLGVVHINGARSFVVADIPGLISGASQGIGLGIRFLKHCLRTQLLLHVVDVSDTNDSEQAIRTLWKELELFDNGSLNKKPQWLVFNKIDCCATEEEARSRVATLIDRIAWTGPVFVISAKERTGTRLLCGAISQYLEQCNQNHSDDSKTHCASQEP